LFLQNGERGAATVCRPSTPDTGKGNVSKGRKGNNDGLKKHQPEGGTEGVMQRRMQLTGVGGRKSPTVDRRKHYKNMYKGEGTRRAAISERKNTKGRGKREKKGTRDR